MPRNALDRTRQLICLALNFFSRAVGARRRMYSTCTFAPVRCINGSAACGRQSGETQGGGRVMWEQDWGKRVEWSTGGEKAIVSPGWNCYIREEVGESVEPVYVGVCVWV